MFKVSFPSRVKWIGIPSDEDMPLDFHLGGRPQVRPFGVSFPVFDFSCKHPIPGAPCGEVFLPHPVGSFTWVSSSCPPPQLLEDSMIHAIEDLTAGSKPMVVGPSSYDGIELSDQLSSRTLFVFFDDSSNLFQKRLHVLFGGCGQDHAMVVLTYMLSQEIETILDMGDDG